jgi:hypothetical protein
MAFFITLKNGSCVKHEASKTTWFNNKDEMIIHRNGGRPAVIYTNGTKEYWQDGKRHRNDNGLPAVERHNKKKEWWFEGHKISKAFSKKISQRIRARKWRLYTLVFHPKTKWGKYIMKRDYEECIKLFQ